VKRPAGRVYVRWGFSCECHGQGHPAPPPSSPDYHAAGAKRKMPGVWGQRPQARALHRVAVPGSAPQAFAVHGPGDQQQSDDHAGRPQEAAGDSPYYATGNSATPPLGACPQTPGIFRFEPATGLKEARTWESSGGRLRADPPPASSPAPVFGSFVLWVSNLFRISSFVLRISTPGRVVTMSLRTG
jgi:hypothetical protein